MNDSLGQWVNTEPDAGAPPALLGRLAEIVPVSSMEDLWLFPTRRTASGESTVFVIAAFEEDPERRRVITARFAVARDRRGGATVRAQVDEHGTAPAAAVARIVHGVLQRMGEEGERPPTLHRVGRDPERWWDLVEALGGRRPATGEDGTAPGPAEPPANAGPTC